jgi:hypothetical protein
VPLYTLGMNSSQSIAPAVPTPDALRAYVNERGVSVPHGASALDVVRAYDPAAADALLAGTQRLTDSRGLPIDASTAAHGGAIYRLLPVRASSSEPMAGPA